MYPTPWEIAKIGWVNTVFWGHENKLKNDMYMVEWISFLRLQPLPLPSRPSPDVPVLPSPQ